VEEEIRGMTFEEIKNNPIILTWIKSADKRLHELGFTEHNIAHLTHVTSNAIYLLSELGYDEHTVELTKIACYLHDIGNAINRTQHNLIGSILASQLLQQLQVPIEDISIIANAICCHDVPSDKPTTPVAAALIIADKSDVRQSRVREKVEYTDIHDRVNYSVKKRELKINNDHTIIKLKLEIDTKVSSVMDYFEIFLTRMLMCKSAAAKLNIKFKLIINEQTLI
jgi:HD superfamily phosphodiesterase